MLWSDFAETRDMFIGDSGLYTVIIIIIIIIIIQEENSFLFGMHYYYDIPGLLDSIFIWLWCLFLFFLSFCVCFLLRAISSESIASCFQFYIFPVPGPLNSSRLDSRRVQWVHIRRSTSFFPAKEIKEKQDKKKRCWDTSIIEIEFDLTWIQWNFEKKNCVCVFLFLERANRGSMFIVSNRLYYFISFFWINNAEFCLETRL